MELSIAQQIVLLILGAGITGAFGMWCWMRYLGYTRWATGHSDDWEEELYQRQKKRVLSIKTWASMKMDIPPKNCQRLNYHILVTYEELLQIWDKCDRIVDDLV